MCVKINDRVLQSMSVVIGICGTNFCTFWADGRRVVTDPETASRLDDTVGPETMSLTIT